MKYITIAITACLLSLKLHAQVNRNVQAQLIWTGKDSVVHTIKNKAGTLSVQMSTGEVSLRVPLKTFVRNDSAFAHYMSAIQNPMMELFMVLEGDVFAFHSGGNQYTSYVTGMLHLNGHFHPVKVKYTIFRKSVGSDLSDFTYLMSLKFSIDPAHYELNMLSDQLLSPFVFQFFKQPYTFNHNR